MTDQDNTARTAPGSSMALIDAALGGIANRRLLDVGCGRGALAAALIERGAAVTGIDPNAEAISFAREAAPAARFEVAPGEALPFADGGFDGVIFANSLHHVPEAVMVPSLQEAARVTVDGGSIVVVEPVAEGSNFLVRRSIEDETEVRAAALAAIAAAAADGVFTVETDIVFERLVTVADADAIVASSVAVNPQRRAAAEAARDRIAATLEQYGKKTEDGYVLSQPMRGLVLRVGKGAEGSV